MLKLLGFDPQQHFTQPPPRFSQATLIKELEEKGIGRPSTYVSIMNSLTREYVEEDESKRLRPTSLGRVVSDLLVAGFPDILEVGFTAKMEEELDDVEEGRENWVADAASVLEAVRASGSAKRKRDADGQAHRTSRPASSAKQDGGEMVIKWGRNGEFLACSNYPKCRNTKEFKRDEQGGIQYAGVGRRDADRCHLRQVRKPMIRQPLALRRVPRMLRLSRLRRHQEAQGRAGQHRGQVPRVQRGRDSGAAHAARQDFLGMRRLSEVQIRQLGQGRPASLPRGRLAPTWWRKSPRKKARDGSARPRDVTIGSRFRPPSPPRPAPKIAPPPELARA